MQYKKNQMNYLTYNLIEINALSVDAHLSVSLSKVCYKVLYLKVKLIINLT